MSTLRSALEELRAEDLRSSSGEELGEDLVELERPSRVLEAERSRRLVEVERRGAWSVDGHLSVVSWLAARLRVGFSRASQQVKLSRALGQMPVTAEALGSGELSSEAAGLLISARDAAPEAFSQAEPMLVDAAGAPPGPRVPGGHRLLAPGCGRLRGRGTSQADPRGPPPARLTHDRRYGPDRRGPGSGVGTEPHRGAPLGAGRLGEGRGAGSQDRSPTPGRCPHGALPVLARQPRASAGRR